MRQPGDDSDEMAPPADYKGSASDYQAELDAIIADLEGREKADKRPVQYGVAIEEKPPDVQWLLEGILPAGGIGIIAAEGGMGKSTLMAQMGLTMAGGLPEFLGFKIPAAVRVLYLQTEGSRHLWNSRLWVAGSVLGLSAKAKEIPFYTQPKDREWYRDIRPMSNGVLAGLINSVKAQLVILDTQGFFHEADENSNTDVKLQLIEPLRNLAVETGAAFILVHHENKPGKDRSTTRRHRIRGAAAFVDDTDLSMVLEAPDGDKQPSRVLAFCKNRSGAHPEDIALEFSFSEALFRQQDMVALEAEKAEAQAAEDRRKVAELAERMHQVVTLNTRYSADQIDELLKPARREHLVAARKQLLDAKRIFSDRDEKDHRKLVYYAATP